MTDKPALQHRLSAVEYFTFGFGTMVGVGWLVLMDDWLARGGPAGTMIGFLLGGLLLLPIARVYGSLVRRIPDAGAEIAYTEGVFPPLLSFATGWTMVLAYAIVCPWEAVATGNVLARLVPELNSWPLYALGGKTIYLPRLAIGLALTALIAVVNLRGIRPSGLFQDITTFGLLIAFAVFVSLGLTRGRAANLAPLFARPGTGGALLSIFLALQIVPYFMTGFESVVKGSEEARAGFDRSRFVRVMYLAVVAGSLFYVVIVGAVAFIHPWRDIVSGHVGTEAAFERAFSSRAMANLVLAAAILSLLKVFNGNFVAATRLMLAIGRRGLVHASLGRVHARHGTPAPAIWLLAGLTAAAAFLGDAVLVPITEVGSLAAGVGWLSACIAWLRRVDDEPRWPAYLGVAVAAGLIAMKVLPGVPGRFTGAEWLALAGWLGLGTAFWGMRRRRPV
jgi:amino acid transporter